MRVGKTSRFIIDNFYIVYMLLAYMSFAYNLPGALRSAFWLLAIAIILPKISVTKPTDKVILVFVCFALTSLIGWVIQPYPFELFIQVFFYCYVPIIFYFVGRKSLDSSPVFYERFLYACIFCFVLGFYWNLTMPGWYVEKSLDILNERQQSYTADTLEFARFHSFLDSYHMGNYGVLASLISLWQLFRADLEKRKRIVYIVLLVISLLAMFLSQQRVSMIGGVLVLGILAFKRYKNKFVFIIPVLIIVMTIPFYILQKTTDQAVVEQVTGRVTNDSSGKSLLDNRAQTWVDAVLNQRDFVFGHGVGGGGQYASMKGIKPFVNDGSYFKILLETGIFSLFIYIYLLLRGIRLSYKFDRLRLEHCILIYFSLSMIGANVCDMPYIITIYWFTLGRVIGMREANIKTKYIL